MAGYATRDKPSTVTAQDLFVKVLVLEDDPGTQLAIVALDLIGVSQGVREDVVVACRELFRLSPESILLNASHTHCGPELWGAKSGIRVATPPAKSWRSSTQGAGETRMASFRLDRQTPRCEAGPRSDLHRSSVPSGRKLSVMSSTNTPRTSPGSSYCQTFTDANETCAVFHGAGPAHFGSQTPRLS